MDGMTSYMWSVWKKVIGVIWKSRRVDWNVHAWTMTTPLCQSMGVVDTSEWACVLCGCHIQNGWVSRATNLHQIFHSALIFPHRNCLDDSEGRSHGQLVTGSFITTTHPLMHHVACRVFDETSNHPGDLAPLQLRFGALSLLAFPKTKITFEKEEVSDHWWDSRKYDWADDGDWEKLPRCQLWRGMKSHCPLYNVSCILCLVSSLISVSIFHITWLDTFWIDLVYKTLKIPQKFVRTKNQIHLRGRIQIQQTKISYSPINNNEQFKKEINKTISFIVKSKRMKYLKISLAKEVKDLYNENYKTFVK